jgi:TonB-linked SusC/RagA family outer membrane protein
MLIFSFPKLSFMKIGVRHFLSKCLLLLLMVGVSSFAMAQTITGTVTDTRTGEALIGANVLVKGTDAGGITDIEGKYTVNVPEGGTVLVFSYTGYSAKEVSIDGRSVVDVTMNEGIDVNELVVVGYGTVKKSDLTGAVTSVKAEDFNKGVVTAPDQLIQGKVSGVQMLNNSGQPGGQTTVRIRGNTSVRGGNQPLYVIDGVPLDNRDARPGGGAAGIGASPGSNPLNFINPNDIASMQVLKDASAAAIYGARGANGVIIITTKKGKAGAPSIDFGASVGTSSILKNYEVLTGDQYRTALSDAGITAGDFGGNVDAMDEILRNGTAQNYNFSIGGGTDAGRYRVSASYLDQKGIVNESDFKKYSANINSQYKFLDGRIGLDFNLLASHTTENLAPIGTNAGFTGSLIGQALQWNPTEELLDVNGVEGFNIDAAGFSKVNPLATLAAHSDVANVTNVLASISPSVNITDDLQYRYLFSVKRGVGNRRASMASWLNAEGIQGIGRAGVENTLLTTQQSTHTLSYNKAVTSAVSVNAVVGYEYQKYANEGSYMTGQGFATDEFDYTYGLQGTDLQNRVIGGFSDPVNELQSVFARGIFNIQDKYIITGTIRRDGSSKFGENNKYGTFPSVAAAWNLDAEGFLPEAINTMKLRASWGQTGNQEFPAGAATERYAPAQNRTFDVINFSNPDLKWETTTAFNIGVDFAVLDYKLSGSLEYFYKDTKDLLFPQTGAQPAPAGIIWKNIDGNLINSGVELSLLGFLIDNDKLSWTLGGNVTLLTNQMTNFDPLSTVELGELFGQGLSDATTQRLTNDQPLNVYYLPEFTGLDDNGFSTFANDGEKAYLGSPNPTTLLGFTTSVSAGDLDVTLNFNGAMGHYIYNNTANAVLAIGNLGSRNIDAALLGNGEATANVPSPSSRYLEKGDYLKLANMTVGYTIGDIGALKNVRITLTGQNLLVFTNYSGFDPEVNTVNFNDKGIPSFGIEYTPYPAVRTFLFGVNCSL